MSSTVNVVQNVTQKSGIGVLGLLGTTFVVLKLQGIITWSWWWVTLPFWGLPAILCLLGIIFLGLAWWANS